MRDACCPAKIIDKAWRKGRCVKNNDLPSLIKNCIVNARAFQIVVEFLPCEERVSAEFDEVAHDNENGERFKKAFIAGS